MEENVIDEKEKNDLPDISETIGNNLVENMPDVSESAINAFMQKQEKTETVNDNTGNKPLKQKTDKYGNPPNPEWHEFESDGVTPKINRDGYVKLIRGKKDVPKNGRQSVINKGDEKQSDIVNNPNVVAQASGKVAASLLITLGITIGGDEWQPKVEKSIGLDEAAQLEAAFSQYFEATGQTDLPPGMVLAVAVGGYVLPRVNQPKTKNRLKKIGEKIALIWYRFKDRKKSKKEE